jgi:hypothetical protein
MRNQGNRRGDRNDISHTGRFSGEKRKGKLLLQEPVETRGLPELPSRKTETGRNNTAHYSGEREGGVLVSFDIREDKVKCILITFLDLMSIP